MSGRTTTTTRSGPDDPDRLAKIAAAATPPEYPPDDGLWDGADDFRRDLYRAEAAAVEAAVRAEYDPLLEAARDLMHAMLCRQVAVVFDLVSDEVDALVARVAALTGDGALTWEGVVRWPTTRSPT